MPQHVGEIILRDLIVPMGISKSAAAQALGISRGHLARILSGRNRLTPSIAHRIEQVFEIRMEYLLQLQMTNDIAEMRRRDGSLSRHLEPIQLSLPAL